MSQDPPEIPLTGGNVNPTVVRVGQTVRRAPTPHGAAVHALMDHLHRQGFDDSPRFLGHDAQGREVLRYLPGDAMPHDGLWHGDAPLLAAVDMLRRFHAATADFDGSGHHWAYTHPDPQQRHVICHNDFAPYNMVFQDGVPWQIIDLDLCGPGPRLRDLAYLAYWMVPLGAGDAAMAAAAAKDRAAGSPRLRQLMQTYGCDDPPALLQMVSQVLHHMGDFAAASAMVGPKAARRLQEAGHLRHWQTEAASFAQNLPALIARFQSPP